MRMKKHMAKRKNKKRKSIRHQESFFKTSEARTIEQFLIASIITGTFMGIGTVLGNVLGKYLLKEVEKTVPLPESMHAAIEKA
jgi:F0F1-type ATP synthase assembly protein I